MRRLLLVLAALGALGASIGVGASVTMVPVTGGIDTPSAVDVGLRNCSLSIVIASNAPSINWYFNVPEDAPTGTVCSFVAVEDRDVVIQHVDGSGAFYEPDGALTGYLRMDQPTVEGCIVTFLKIADHRWTVMSITGSRVWQ